LQPPRSRTTRNSQIDKGCNGHSIGGLVGSAIPFRKIPAIASPAGFPIRNSPAPTTAMSGLFSRSGATGVKVVASRSMTE
jgi:hypothetical protein